MFIFRWIGKVISLIWKALNLLRQTIANVILVMAFIALGIWASTFFDGPSLRANTVLVLDLSGRIVEQKPHAPFLGDALLGDERHDTDLHDVIETLKSAQKDRSIAGLLLRLDDLEASGVASSRELGAAIDRFKQSGKTVWAWGTNFTQAQYGIATHASEIYLHPMGEIEVKGLGSNRLYYGELLNKLGVNVHVFKAGAYKSFPESFILNAPSKEALAAEKVWLFDAWKTYATDMEGSRGLMPGAIDAYIEELPQRVRNARGDMAQAAINAGLIDGVKTIEEVKDYIEARLGKGKKIEANFVSYLHYGEGLNHIATPGSIAVIVAEGEIHTGPSDVGIIGSKTLLEQIQTAVDDANIKAIILRVNSPGGSAVASELIRGSLETAKKKGKPVVVSMGNTAASGGYWISMGATRVIADPATITGSIGVFGLAPTFEKSLGLAKIGQGGIGTTWLANAGKPTQPLDPRLADILTQNVERTYNNFLTVVAKARKLTINDVHQVAQGRVWTGSQALKHGLVDELGGMHEAFEAARKLAQLPTSTRLVYVSETPMNLASMVRQSLKPLKDPLGSVKIPQALRNEVTQVKDFWTRRLSTPKEVLAHSLCGVEN